MMQTFWAVVQDGRIRPSEPVELRKVWVLVTFCPRIRVNCGCKPAKHCFPRYGVTRGGAYAP